MNPSDISLQDLENICRSAGDFQLQHFRSVGSDAIKDKGLNQLVSFVDVETEKLLVSQLGKLIPESSFITEENTVTVTSNSDYTWIIDPLDGTTNFLHGLAAFSISVALFNKQMPVAGVVYIPYWNEMFSAKIGNGALLNGQRIHTSDSRSLNDSLIATGFPYSSFKHMDQYLSGLQALMKQTRGIRRMGSAAIDLAYTACGRFDGFFEYGLSSWDIAAGIILVSEAGGKISDFRGGDNFIFGGEIVASNPHIYSEFLSTINTNKSA